MCRTILSSSGAKVLLTNYAKIASIAVSSGPVTLEDSDATADLHALALLSGADTLVVDDVLVADVAGIAALGALASMTVSDSAANVQSDLESDGAHVLETDQADITSITVTGIVDLSYTDATLVMPALEKLQSSSLTIDDVPITHIAAVAALAALDSMTVSDTAGHIKTDLLLGASSELALNHLVITGVTISSGGPISLTDAQAQTVVSAALAHLPAECIDVTGVAVGDIATIAADIGVLLDTITVSDTAGAIATDLENGAASSELELHAAKISSVTATGGTVDLTDAAAWAVTAALANLVSGSLVVSGASVLHAATYGALTGLASMTVSDTASDIYNDLTLAQSMLNADAIAGTITGITVTDTAVELTDTQAELVLPALGVLGGFGVIVSNVSVPDIATIGGLGGALSSMTIDDTAARIHDDLVLNTASDLFVYQGKITGVTVTGGRVDILSSQEADVQLSALALLPTDSLIVNGAPVASVAGLAALTGLYQMTVSDTAANLQADMVADGAHILQTNHLLIGSIAVSDGNTVTLDATDAGAASDALALMSVADSLVVTGVSVADTTEIAGLIALTRMTVSDSATDVRDDLELSDSLLEHHAAVIQSIAFSSGSAVTLTGVEAARVMDALAELPGGSLTVTGASTGQIAALAALGALASMTIDDSATDIEDDLALGAASKIEENIGSITGITFTGTINLDYATSASHVMAALAKLPDDGQLTVGDVPVLHIDAIAGLGAILASMTVSDTGSAVQTDLNLGAGSVIETNAGSITGIALTTGSVTLTDSAADLVTAALALLPDGSLTVTGVPADADITTFYDLGARLSGMAISDSAGNIESDLVSGGRIEAALGKITGIAVTGGGTIVLTDSQANDVLGALAKLPASSLTISAVPLDDIATFAALAALNTMAVRDTGGDIAGDLAEVAAGGTSLIYSNSSKISGITLSNGGVTLTDAQADAAFSVLGDLPNSSLTVTGVPLGDVAHISSLGSVLSGITVQASTSAVQNDLASGSVLATAASHITSISLTSGSGQITLTDAQADSAMAVLDALPIGSLVVSGVPVGDVASIAAVTSLNHMTVSDTASAIQTDLALGGSSNILHNIAEIASVTTTDASLAAGVAAAIYYAIPTRFADSALVISDTATDILNAHSAPGAAVLANAATVQLSADAAGLTAAQATTLAGILHGTSSGYTVNVADSAADLLSASYAAGIALATTVGVSDIASNMLASAPALIAMEPKLTSAAITDSGPLSASAVSDLLALPNLSAGSLTIADNGSQIAAAIEANGATGVSFLEAHFVQLSGNSIIAASDAAALEALGGSLNKEGFTISVSDTASHLTDTADGYLAAVSDTTLIDGVYLKTTGGTVTVTAAVAADLIGIPNFHKNPVGGGSNILIVQDTASHFDASYTTLLTDPGLFDHMYLGTSATVNDAVYGELLGLGVDPANGEITLTVRDTATTIAANALSQLGGSPSITPIAWQLSASAAVTVAQAAVLGGLGGLTGFSAGAFTLTLSASDLTASVSQANAIGRLGSAFHLSSYVIDVPGSVQSLSGGSGLTVAALEVVTPQITDSFANIAQLSQSSGLLGGTIAVDDSGSATVAQATSFFGLIQVTNGGAGIPAANVSFNGFGLSSAQVETITDTLENIQDLTGLTSWRNNVSLQSDFHLEVADTVNNLINPSNTTALSGMHGTTLTGDQTTTAASLESLFTLETTIKFSLGAYHVSLQDTAADLLNPSYSDAIALATSLTLLGPDTVGAAGAETLMATGKLVLTGSTILTISDTSSDLLDGVLGGAITGGGYTSYVHVTLSDNETLDAQTAEALVSLPGYTAGANPLSIVDGASYLLNAANHQAEVDAGSVTLDGDAYVSATNAVSLVELPNFALDGNTLYLASNDYANAATLATLAGLGSGFNLNGNTLTMTQDASVTGSQLEGIGAFGSSLHLNSHTLTLTQDALGLTPSEYAAVEADDVTLNGNVLSVIPTAVTVSEVSNTVQVAGTGMNGSGVTLYSASGSVVTTSSASPAFTVSAAESGSGINIAVTETYGGVESAPIIVLEQTILTNVATTDGASFATSGQVQVGTNEYMNLYTAGSQPSNSANPFLVYDPSAHTLSFDATSASPIVLLTLGTATHPASLDPSEIFVKHYVA